METSAPSSRASIRETLVAIEEIRRHEQFLAGPWRSLLDAVQGRLERSEGDHIDGLSVRTARARAATAALEAAQTARFDAHLLSLVPGELAAARGRLESDIDSLKCAQEDAGGHFRDTVEDLLAELTAELAVYRDTARTARRHRRFADDLIGAIRAYEDRIEQTLLDLSEAVRAAFGLSMGAALPTRVRRAIPRPDIGPLPDSDGAQVPGELADTVRRSAELHQERLDQRVDDAVLALRARIDMAVENDQLDDQHTHERISELILQAQQLSRVAETLDWMLLVDCGVSA